MAFSKKSSVHCENNEKSTKMLMSEKSSKQNKDPS